jgi:hypothetical protein
MAMQPAVADSVSSQDRHRTARPPRPWRLGTRLAVLVAVSVAVVVTVSTLAGTRLAERQLSADLRETARITAVALVDDIELRDEPFTRETMLPVLRDLMSAAVDLYSISVFRAAEGGPELVVSASEVALPPTRWPAPERSSRLSALRC